MLGFWLGLYDRVVLFFRDLIGQSLIPEQLGLITQAIRTWIIDRTNQWNTFWDDVKKKVADVLAGPNGVYTIIQSGIDTLTTKISDFITNKLAPLQKGLEDVTSWWTNFKNALGEFIKLVLGGRFAAALALLAPFIGHSPAPLAAGLESITNAMHRLTAFEFPHLASAIQASVAPAMSAGNSYNYTYQTTVSVSGSVRSDQDLRVLSYYIAKEILRNVPR